MIGVVAELLQVHPQTLRIYEREGLVVPHRSKGNTRLYSQEDVENLKVVLRLTRNFGVNLAGVEMILEMKKRMSLFQGEEIDWVDDWMQEIMMARSRVSEPGGENKKKTSRRVIPILHKK